MKYCIPLLLCLFSVELLYAQCNGPGSPCSICEITATITNIDGGSIVDGDSSIPGPLSAGGMATGDAMEVDAENCGELSITVEIDFLWQQGINFNWVHGVSFESSPGWSASTGTPPGPFWISLNSITGCCSGQTYGEGFYFENPDPSQTSFCCGTMDPSNPADNYGTPDDLGVFIFELTYCASSNQDQAMESITFKVTEDGETGDWNMSDGCNYEFEFPININSAGIQLPETHGPICIGQCVDLDAGEGCDSYDWSNGESTQIITVCPTTNSTYSVTVSDGQGCSQMGSTEVLVEECCISESGDIVATTSPSCPGEDIDVMVSNFLSDPEYEQYILIVDGTGTIIEVISGSSHSLFSDICEELTVYAYNREIAGNAPEPFVGMDINTIDCADDANCCDLTMITVSWEDTEVPSFIDPPADLNLTCLDLLPPMDDLEWTDNCSDGDFAIGEETGSATLCAGGTITRTWEATDLCDNTATYIQNINISAPDPIMFDNTPPNEARNCGDIPDPADPLNYTNNGSGDCLSDGSADAVRAENYDICGGTITDTWEATDNCGGMISHVRTYTFNPAPAASFINLPPDQSFACGEYDNNPGDLEYSNGESGDCAIEGSVSPTSTALPDLCGGTLTHTWDFTDACGRPISHTQTITIDPAPQASFDDLPADLTVSCGDFLPMDDLNYSNNASGDCLIEGIVNPITTQPNYPCGGVVTNTWQFTDACGRSISHVQSITIEPSDPAEFLDFPPDVTVQCSDNINTPDDLEYSNFSSGDCLIEGAATAVQTGTVDVCGGALVNTWTFIDPCGRRIDHQQTVLVEPVDPPEFVDPPSDDVIDCSEIPTDAPELRYTNYGSEPCLFEGFVLPQVTENYDSCGGEIIYVWEYSDQCGNELYHTQILEILPLEDPEFIDPPDDITLDCGQDIPPVEPLRYTNNQTGDCALEGEVLPDVEVLDNEIIRTYYFENECTGSFIEHIQTIFVPEVPDIAIDPVQETICLGEEFDLFDIEVFDQNNSNYFITYHSDIPPTAANEILDPLVSPGQTTTYYVVATSDDDCQDIEAFELIVLPSPNAGDDNSGYLCFGSDDVNLFDYLINADNENGTWTDPFFSGVDISDPRSVNFSTQSSGEYIFDYVLNSADCSSDTARITLTLNEELMALLQTIECSNDRTSYTVVVDGLGNQISTNTGTIVGPNGTIWDIIDIPIGQDLVINVSNGVDTCMLEIRVSPPNCDCPQVDPPDSNGDQTICQGETTPQLSVTVGPDEQANWYDSPIGGTLLLSNSLTYLSPETAPGVYTYYVEAESTTNPGCKSATRTPVRLEIIALPVAFDAVLQQCDDDLDGMVSFDLTQAEADLGGGVAGLRYEYYLNITDANNRANALSSPYTNTTNPQVLFVAVVNSSNCVDISELSLVVNPLPEISLDISNETCSGEEDGVVIILGTSDHEPLEYSINGFFYFSDAQFDSLSPGVYTAYVRDSNLCISSVDFEIEEGLILSVDNLVIECLDNGTDTDPSDDYYVIRVTISNNLGTTGSYTVSDGANNYGTGTYGVELSFQIPANDQQVTLNFEDAIFACSVSETIGPLRTCSSDCEIIVNSEEIECFDNGTELDPTDDYYEIRLNVSSINGSSTNQFRISEGGVRIGIYRYDEDIVFTLPATNSVTSVLIEDLEDDQCRLNLDLGNLESCSDGCLVEAVILNLECLDNGTIGDDSDDLFQFEISSTSINASSRWFVLGETDTLANGSSMSFGPFDISSGSRTYIIIDHERPECSDTITVDPPPACSNPCELEIVNLQVGNCNDNNTGNTEDDDFFTVSFEVNAILGPVSDFWVNDGTNNYGPYSYSTQVMIDLPADGSNITLTITDTMSAQCEISLEVSQDPCSSCDQQIDAGQDQLISCSRPQVQLTGFTSEPGNITWTGPNSFMSNDLIINVDVNGWYYLEISYLDACVFVDSVFVGLDADIPVADAGPDGLLNCLRNAFILDGTNSTQGPDLQFEWQDSLGNVLGEGLNFEVNSTGSYYLVVIDTVNNCRSPRDLVEVTEDYHTPNGVIYANPGLTLDCVVETIELSTDDEEHVIYTWTIRGQDFTGSVKVVVDSGYVSLYAIDTLTGCDTITGINIEDFTQFPFVNVEDPDSITCRAPSVIIDASASQRTQGLLIEWSNEDGTVLNTSDYTLEVFDEGTYFFRLWDTIIGCSTLDSVIVEDLQAFPVIDAGEDREINCQDETEIRLAGSIIDAQGALEYNWLTSTGQIIEGGSSLEPLVGASGYYILEVSNIETGCSTRDSVLIILDDNRPEAALIVVEDEKCEGDNNGLVNIFSVEGGTEPYSYYLDGDLQNQSNVGNLSPGTYDLRIVDAKGCVLDTSFVIEAGVRLLSQVDSVINLEYGEERTLYLLVNIPEDEISSIEWRPSDQLSCDSCMVTTLIGEESGNYQVTVIDINGCLSRSNLRLIVDKNFQVFVPNSFSPNGDGSNDFFTVYSRFVERVNSMSIYNRWGDLVFIAEDFPSNSPTEGWDGMHNGKELNPAVFVYVVELTMVDGSKKVISGDVSLIK